MTLREKHQQGKFTITVELDPPKSSSAQKVFDQAARLKGKVDAILLTGGMARDTELCDKLAEYISWIAPIYNYAGSFETEALGFGAIRVLKGEEEAKTYTGKPVWDGFSWDK